MKQNTPRDIHTVHDDVEAGCITRSCRNVGLFLVQVCLIYYMGPTKKHCSEFLFPGFSFIFEK